MKRQIALLIALIFMAVGAAHAAKSVVDRAVAQIESAPSIVATFRINGEDGSLTMCGDNFILEVPGMKTAFNGNTQWTLNVPDQELTITTPTPEELAVINPLGFIGALRSQFAASTLPDGRVRFTPAAPGSDVSEIVAKFSTSTAMPTLISMKSAAGEMLIDNIQVTRGTKALPASRFTIKATKGITVTDLR